MIFAPTFERAEIETPRSFAFKPRRDDLVVERPGDRKKVVRWRDDVPGCTIATIDRFTVPLPCDDSPHSNPKSREKKESSRKRHRRKWLSEYPDSVGELEEALAEMEAEINEAARVELQLLNKSKLVGKKRRRLQKEYDVLKDEVEFEQHPSKIQSTPPTPNCPTEILRGIEHSTFTGLQAV